MIDKQYFQADMAVYYRDFLIPMAVFIAGFAWCATASGPIVVVPMVICMFAMHRSGAFVHEITHRQRDEKMKPFIRLWNLTIGAIVFVPAPRFYKPHLTHHSVGVFGTKDDPQYLPLRTDIKLMIFVLFIVPFLMPIFNLFMTVTASLGVNAEQALERFLRRYGFTMGSDIEEQHRKEVTYLSRYYLVVFAIYLALLSETLPLLYFIQVGAWLLVTVRIPLEHRMEKHVEETTARDHVLDSFSVEAPLAVLVQPLGLQFHTAHHMYPGVPYYKLRALHYELKARGDQDYNNNTISFWQAVRGPKPAA